MGRFESLFLNPVCRETISGEHGLDASGAYPPLPSAIPLRVFARSNLTTAHV